MIVDYLNWKMEYYMKNYILSQFNPEKIHWYFSLSGGKDSYVLSRLVCDWYKVNGMQINATGIHVIQWEDSKIEIEERFNWLSELIFFDARYDSMLMAESIDSAQAPCSNCSGIRKKSTDNFFRSINTGNNVVNILCRGLHLTDMANSLIWRLIWDNTPIESMLKYNKGKPIVKLFENLYLAKPLCLMREYECQIYADYYNYKAYQCICPALKYPSRRDILEESANLFYSSSLWEFDIPGMDSFFSMIMGCNRELVKNHSIPGKERKQATLPDEYFDYAVENFRIAVINNEEYLLSMVVNKNVYIENYMPDFLLHNKRERMTELNPNFKLLTSPQKLTRFDKVMISTLGPLWGAFSLDDISKIKLLSIQESIFNFHVDSAWSQVITLLEQYYKSIIER